MFFYPTTLIIIIFFFFEKKIGSVCLFIFESDKVLLKVIVLYRLLVYFLGLTVCSESEEEKKIWKWPVSWSFSEFFFPFFPSPYPKPEKKIPYIN